MVDFDNLSNGDLVEYIGVNGVPISFLTLGKYYEVMRRSNKNQRMKHFYITCDDNIDRMSDGSDFTGPIEMKKMNSEINFLDLLKGY